MFAGECEVCSVPAVSDVPDENAQLVNTLLDEELSYDEFCKLEKAVLSCDATCAYYIDQMDAHLALHSLLSEAP